MGRPRTATGPARRRAPAVAGTLAEATFASDATTEPAIDEIPRPLAEHEFQLFQALIEREAGIHLGSSKKALLVGRLRRRLVKLGMRSFSEYYRLISSGDASERIHMLDAISTNETSFFREPAQFAFLTQQALPRWIAEAADGRRPRSVRAWSAACSTGQEPFSLAMVLLDQLAASGFTLEVLASDLSTRVLEKASLGTYPIELAKDIPPDYLRRFMLRGRLSQQGRMRVCPAVREIVSFRRINLNDDVYPAQGPFDLILCRNVMMYFETAVKRRVVRRLLDVLAPGGFLFLGHAESLTGLSEDAHVVGPTIYARGARPR